MRRVWLGDTRSPLGKAAAKGLKAFGWRIDTERDAADARVIVLKECTAPGAMPEGTGTLIFLAPAGDRLAISALSLSTQRLAVAAAPGVRVGTVVVDQGHEDQIGAAIDWFARAEMVTGQLILLSGAPGRYQPMW